ncbi:MAG: recombinase A [Deltaproteobacteria bacterium]|nr:recombinase A [Deltaproteobacteria bacterium]
MALALEEALRARRFDLRRGRLPAPAPEAEAPRGSLESLRGRLVQLDGGVGAGAALTLAAAYLREAQGAGEPVAWIQGGAAGEGEPSIFFPADLLAWGIDLSALPVVRAKGAPFAAADKLLRSGAFGLLVIDLAGPGELPLAAQTRLSGLAQRHECVVIFLTDRGPEDESLGSLLSLRLSCRWRRDGGRFLCRAEALKDKRLGPGWSRELEVTGAPGLR